MAQQKNYAFSEKALTSATPLWAKRVFRITLMLTTAFAGFVAATNLISEEYKYEVILGLKFLDPFIYGLSKMFGVEPADEEN